MHSTLCYVFTFGIPLLGVAICIVVPVVCFRRVVAQRISRTAAVFLHLAATSLPVGLALLATQYGRYLAAQRENYAFFGEGTWALSSLMVIYVAMAVVSHLGLWLALARLKRR